MTGSRTTLIRTVAAVAVITGGVIASPVRGDIADAVGGALGLHGAQIVPNNPHNPANALVANAVPTLGAHALADELHLILFCGIQV